jgi:predicted chitinase
LGTGDEVVKQLTKRVNGGLHGYDDRLAKFKMYLSFVQPK